ncbi:hypothetical protein D3C87_460120 [compost metagenome]
MTTNTRLYANNAKTTLATSVLATDTTLLVANGALFPSPTAGQFFLVTIDTGSTYEIVKVTGRSGNTFTGCTRGFEGTTASPYQAGTRIENRITAGTAADWTRFEDKLANIPSVDVLSSPNGSDSDSYLTASTDDGGTPIVAVQNAATNTWRFLNYPTRVLSGTVTGSSTTTSVDISGASATLPLPQSGKYIIQFVTGANQGLCRAVTNVVGNTISWTTALPGAAAASDGFEVYKSESSILNDLLASADDALIFSIILN